MTFQAEPHAILVDRTGRRFVSECDYNIGEAVDRRGSAHRKADASAGLPVIADRRFLGHSSVFRWYARRDPDWIVKAGSIDALAEQIKAAGRGAGGDGPEGASTPSAGAGGTRTSGAAKAFGR